MAYGATLFGVAAALCSWRANSIIAGQRNAPGGVLDDFVQISNDSMAISNDTDEAFFEHLPRDLKELRRTYQVLLMQDILPNGSYPRSPNAGKVRMVLGVMSMYNQRHRNTRGIIRSTWLAHPDVCLISRPSNECSIYIVFVICQGRIPSKMTMRSKGQLYLQNERDVMVLEGMMEGMNEGKTHRWLSTATRQYPWADYIAKCDEDAFPHATPILNALPVHQPKHCEAFLGKAWTCTGDGCPSTSCGPPLGHNLTAFNDTNKKNKNTCFAYMQGGFYAVSKGIAKNITGPNGFLTKDKVGPEDLMTGSAVSRFAREYHKCVYIWDSETVVFDRMFHHLRGENEHPGHISPAWDRYYHKQVDGDFYWRRKQQEKKRAATAHSHKGKSHRDEAPVEVQQEVAEEDRTDAPDADQPDAAPHKEFGEPEEGAPPVNDAQEAQKSQKSSVEDAK